jgi:hypothetical protein
MQRRSGHIYEPTRSLLAGSAGTSSLIREWVDGRKSISAAAASDQRADTIDGSGELNGAGLFGLISPYAAQDTQ